MARRPKRKGLITENATRIRFRGDDGTGVLDVEVNVGQRTFAGAADQWLCLMLASGEGWYFTRADAMRLREWLNKRIQDRRRP